MSNKNISELTFNLPPIKFSEKSGVKKLDVVVHATIDDSSQIYDYLNELVLKQIEEKDEFEE